MTLGNQTKETKKEHDGLISIITLSGLGKGTFRVDFRREQRFPKTVIA